MIKNTDYTEKLESVNNFFKFWYFISVLLCPAELLGTELFCRIEFAMINKCRKVLTLDRFPNGFFIGLIMDLRKFKSLFKSARFNPP